MKVTDGQVLYFNKETNIAIAVELATADCVKFHTTHWYSGWPTRPPKEGDKIRIRRSDEGEFLCARLSS